VRRDLAAGPIASHRTTEELLEEEILMAVNWIKDVDTAFAKAKAEHRPVLLDFSAAPA